MAIDLDKLFDFISSWGNMTKAEIIKGFENMSDDDFELFKVTVLVSKQIQKLQEQKKCQD